MRVVAGAAALLLLGGCAFEPEGAVRIDPPLSFEGWWQRTEVCSGRAADFSRVQFFSVPGGDFACPSGRCVGRWEPGHRIYLSERYAQSELVVRHEMLHELLGKSGHPNPPFGAGCPLTWESWPSGDRRFERGLGVGSID